MKELIEIQAKLNAPKGQYNRFGSYFYRSCEDILAAVKPLLGATNCTLTISDEIISVGERIYVKATATLSNASGECVTTQAFAREESEKKGMDGAQITGAASSYARKYALNGLFAIDDTKDADTTNTHGQTTPAAKPAAAKPAAAKPAAAKPAAAKPAAAKPAAAKSATQPAQYATEPPAAQHPEVPEEQTKKFLEVSVTNTTKAAFLKAFNDLKTHNPEFNSVYWRYQANKHYASLTE